MQRGDGEDGATAPYLLRMSAGWSWRILVVFAAVALLVILIARVHVLALAVVASLLITALLRPLDVLLRDKLRLPAALAALLSLLLFLGVLAGIGFFVSNQAASQTSQLSTSVGQGVDEVQNWLTTGPLHLNPQRITNYRGQIVSALQSNRGRVVSGVVTGATLAVEVLTGIVLVLFAVFFLLKDGEGLWRWVVRLFSPDVRAQVDETGRRAWSVLTAYIRGIVIIAAADAVFIGIALLVVGVPLVVPLALLTFLGAFVPIIGAFVAGFVSVLVALVALGPVAALIILIAIVVIQQLEGNVLHPVVMKRAVDVHPLVSIFAVATGTTLAGIPGAIVAVPLIAVGNEVVRYLASLRGPRPAVPPPDQEGAFGDSAPPAPEGGRRGGRKAYRTTDGTGEGKSGVATPVGNSNETVPERSPV